MKRIEMVAAMAAAGVVLAMGAAASAQANIEWTGVGVYDPTAEAGQPGDNWVRTEAAANTKSLATFKTDVLNAFNSGIGGVVNFDASDYGESRNDVSNENANAAFGTGNTKILNFTADNTLQTMYRDLDFGTDAISGNYGWTQLKAYGAFSLLFSITGGDSGEGIRELGFTMLSRSTSGNITRTAKAYYSGGGTSDTTSEVVNASGDDTFYHFVAPGAETITKIEFNGASVNANRLQFDDFGFITNGSSVAPGGDLTIRKFCDTNQDAVFNGYDEYVAGWEYNVSNVAHGGTYDEDHVTDENGRIDLTGLDAGDYTITETLKKDWTLTTGNSPVVVTVSGGLTHVENFGNILPGDANMDGMVDGVDFTYLKANFGQGTEGDPTVWREANFNYYEGDWLVDGADFTILKANFGKGEKFTGSPVPEPATLVLLGAALPVLLKRRRNA